MPYKPKTNSYRQYESSPFKSFYEKQKLESKKQYDKTRGSSSDRGYNGKWQKARKAWLSKPENALCSDCLSAGRTAAATEVHHTVKHKGNWAIFWDSSLWVGLCHSCHSKRTAAGE